MSSQAPDQLVKEAERLPAEDRIQIVERILASLDRADPTIDAEWVKIAEARLDEYIAGNAPATDAYEAVAKHFKR
jgi:putative addiction module component (TIGR02574 family)